MSLWTQQFAQALRREQLKRLPPAHLDAILLWLSHPENPQSADLTEAFSRVDLSRDTASRRIYTLLDQQLFSGSPPAPTTLGLAPNTAPEIVKQRYRRLMQVYHPDRHATKPLWATQRTERINLAFDAHRRGSHGWAHPTALSKIVALRQAQLQQLWQQMRPYWRHLTLGLVLIGVAIGSVALLLNTPPKLIAPPPMIAAAPAPVDCNSVLLPLINFQRAYRAGELNALMALYSSEAQENELTDWSRIRQAYAELFQKTSVRSIHFTQVRIKSVADNIHCLAMANYEVNYQNEQLQQITRVGLIVFLFEQQAATFHILRMRY
ncbi:J domain-containing protein [Chromatium okenii]|uniref:J domain-containing protein n=1 Tax=Chromatium okenii TaxID=61644 RepID=UPI0026F21526|nr:J domain-containing protein [Chromatium okenii]MBV5308715.1 J domain-containing protein [Chromatium okenii]